jgi:hypothetical protein
MQKKITGGVSISLKNNKDLNEYISTNAQVLKYTL